MSTPDKGGRRFNPETVALVEKRIAEMATDAQIVSELSHAYAVRPKEGRNVIRHVRGALLHASDKDTQTRRAEILLSLEEIFRQAMRAEPMPHLQTALKAVDQICKLLGLNEAEKVQVIDGLSASGALTSPTAVIARLRELEVRPLPELPTPTEPPKN